MPYKIPACAGKPYRPSNGTEGMMFMEAFCERCTKDRFDETGKPEDGCDILMRTLCHEIKDAEYPPEWTHTAEFYFFFFFFFTVKEAAKGHRKQKTKKKAR